MILSALLICQGCFTLEKRRARGASGVSGGFTGAKIGAAAGSAIPGVGTVAGGIVGGVIGGVGGLLFGGEEPEDKERRLLATESLRRQRRMQQFLEKQATQPLTGQDTARHSQLMKTLGPQIGAGLGRRGLGTSALGAGLASQASGSALAQLSEQRQARAQSLLMGMPSGEAFFQEQDKQSAQYWQDFGDIIGMMKSDQQLSSLPEMEQMHSYWEAAGGGRPLPGMNQTPGGGTAPTGEVAEGQSANLAPALQPGQTGSSFLERAGERIGVEGAAPPSAIDTNITAMADQLVNQLGAQEAKSEITRAMLAGEMSHLEYNTMMRYIESLGGQ